jgi:hypothetical protein
MPQRKRRPTEDKSNKPAESEGRQKRQRVSLACDPCRTAREKCDGGRPECGTCRTQGRSCSYTPTSKKRGVKTGYLRTIELSLAWLFDEVPDAEKALHRVLSENNGALADQLFVAKGKSSDRLYRKWMKSRVRQDIEHVLSEDRPARNDTSANESDDDSSGQDSQKSSTEQDSRDTVPVEDSHAASEQETSPPTQTYQSNSYPKLPVNWRRYVDIYFTYTHCWLPIVYRDDVFKTALSYTSEGYQLSRHSDPYTISCHSQLWAILTIGAFEDANCATPSVERDVSPQDIYEISKTMIPSDDSNFERPMMCTLILHALILIGKGKNVAAWIIIGRAMRLILSTEQHTHTTDTINSRYLANNPVLAACYLLDTLLAICLGRPAHTATELQHHGQSIMSFCAPESPETWTAIAGFGPSIQNQPASGYPFLTLYQLLEFSITAGAKVQSDKQPHKPDRRITADDLVRSLHPRLQFCSSLNVGSFVPNMPSALLLQVAFLANTILISGHRASLLSGLLEIIEQIIEQFGGCGTSPLVACFMESVEKQVNFDDMRPSERSKWLWLREKVLSPWQSDQPLDSQNFYGHGSKRTEQLYSSATQSFTPPLHGQSYRSGSASAVLEEYSQSNRLSAEGYTPYLEPYITPAYPGKPTGSSTSPALQTPSMPGQGSTDVARQATQQFPVTIGNQPIDYDAIFDELGSIDYGDTMELDPQFMVNLGFAPGCNVADMFQGDFGG